MVFSTRNSASQIRLLIRLTVVAAILAVWLSVAVAEQQQRITSSQVPRRDLAAAQALANQVAALSPSVRPEEAQRLAECVYAIAGKLRREYGVLWPPLFDNFLVNSGIKKRGLCFQWAEDLLVRLDALKLASLELHWGEAEVRTWQESNCIVVTAKGDSFNTGIILDCWRHSGHLYWTGVAADKVSWVENKKYANFVRARSARAVNHPVAFQRSLEAIAKPTTSSPHL
jgi:hypothetical protein